MARSDRLVDLVRLLRNGRVHRAQDLADRLNVSIRTIYRDMDTLIASGIPIEGNRGLGYRATAELTLPPINLTMTELEALHMGLSVVGQAGDDELKEAARILSAKIDASLPEDRRTTPAGFGFATYPFADTAKGLHHMPQLRSATRARQKLRITVRDSDGNERDQVIRPLQLDYWGRVWTVATWSETDSCFHEFRVDRITRLVILPQLFVDEDGKSLSDYLASAEPDTGKT